MLRGLAVAVLFSACTCGESLIITGGDGGTAGGTGGGSGGGDGGGAAGGTADAGCVNLQCRQVSCPDGGTTRLTGTVTTPAGTLPLHNALVYIPNAQLGTIPTGASCDLCDTMPSGSPVVQAKTDPTGSFRLDNVPTGSGLTLVIQAGKWRREVPLPDVAACAVTSLGDTRLPKNSSEGHLPKIAVATGGADPLECLLRKIGVDLAEFTPAAGNGRVNLYAGHAGTPRYAATLNNGDAFPASSALWNSLSTLRGYDLLLLSCEGNLPDPNKTVPAAAEMQSYLHLGGRVFGSHLHQYWIVNAPAPFPSVATFGVHPDLPSPFTATVDTSFPRGQELAQWLRHTGASMTAGQIDINAGQHSIESVNPMHATRWIFATNPQTVQYFSFKAPVGAMPSQQCGRFVLTDIHVSSGDTSSTGTVFPDGCTTTTLSAQEKALVYMLFDLSNCVSAEIN